MNELTYEDDTGLPAFMLARNLASLICTNQKSVVFDMNKVAASYVPCPSAARPLTDAEVDALTSVTSRNRAKALADYGKALAAFAEDLADAMTVDDVQEIAPCYLAEIGHTDRYPELGQAWVFIVAPLPAPKDVYVMDV